MSAELTAPGRLRGTLGAIAVPARMRATMLRRSLREHPGPTVAGLVGLLAAAWLIRYALRGDQHTLGLLVGAWVLGWIVLPLLLGGGRGRVRPAHLRLEPIGGVPAAIGLLAASAIGIGPAVSLVALAALPAHAARHGTVAVLVTAGGAVLLWLLGLIGSAIALEVVGHAGGPAGALLTGVFTGTAMGVAGSLWAVFPWVSVLLVAAPEEVVRAMAYVPSAWPLAAVTGPTGQGARLMATLVGIVALCAAAYIMIVRRVIATGVPFRPRRTTAASPAAAEREWLGWVPAATRAVAGRELRAWTRHPLRLQYLAFAVVYGALLAGLPLLSDVDVLLPWAGPLAVLGAAAMSAGLVGLDGTALWLPLTTPDGERAEVRDGPWPGWCWSPRSGCCSPSPASSSRPTWTRWPRSPLCRPCSARARRCRCGCRCCAYARWPTRGIRPPPTTRPTSSACWSPPPLGCSPPHRCSPW